jgi:hypothetical protein
VFKWAVLACVWCLPSGGRGKLGRKEGITKQGPVTGNRLVEELVRNGYHVRFDPVPVRRESQSFY